MRFDSSACHLCLTLAVTMFLERGAPVPSLSPRRPNVDSDHSYDHSKSGVLDAASTLMTMPAQ